MPLYRIVSCASTEKREIFLVMGFENMAETREIIRELCRKKGISATTLESELGFGNGSLTKGSTLRSDRLYQVARYFSVPLEYLITGEMPNYYYDSETAEMAQAAHDDPMTKALFDAGRGSKPEDIQMAIDLLNRLKETNRND